MSQKTAEEEERYKKEMEKYRTNFDLKMIIRCQYCIDLLYENDLVCFLTPSVGLRLWRGRTTESGRRTGEPKPGPGALRAPTLERAHHPSHQRKKTL